MLTTLAAMEVKKKDNVVVATESLTNVDDVGSNMTLEVTDECQ